MRCGDCKFWGQKGDTGQFRQCRAVPHDKDGYTDENNYDLSDPYWDEEDRANTLRARAENMAVVADGSGYFAALKVREDYGCVLFSPLSSSEV